MQSVIENETEYYNPVGTHGFDFIEFAATDTEPLHQLFNNLGFTAVASSRDFGTTHFKQGDIHFFVTQRETGFASDFTKKHGPCACSFAIRVKDIKKALSYLEKKGANIIAAPESDGLPGYAIEGIGKSRLYLLDDTAIYKHFSPLKSEAPENRRTLKTVDHLTHNVYQGQLKVWADFYERLFNFREIRYFDISGEYTGLFSRAMTAPCGKVRIPLNESSDDKSQIAEYLEEYKGEGIQHIALATEDIYGTVEKLKQSGVPFMQPPPDTYYEMLDERVPHHTEDLDRMRKNGILMDGTDKDHILLQIFTEPVIGPIFFEIIQRKGDEGFGEGNFTALFKSMEQDQIRRGVLKVES